MRCRLPRGRRLGALRGRRAAGVHAEDRVPGRRDRRPRRRQGRGARGPGEGRQRGLRRRRGPYPRPAGVARRGDAEDRDFPRRRSRAADRTLRRVTRGADTGYFIAIKHIYDSHYFLADTEFLTLVPDTTDQSRFYLVDVVRARIDPPRRLRGLLLGKIKGSMKDALATEVKATRQRLEAGAAP